MGSVKKLHYCFKKYAKRVEQSMLDSLTTVTMKLIVDDINRNCIMISMAITVIECRNFASAVVSVLLYVNVVLVYAHKILTIKPDSG